VILFFFPLEDPLLSQSAFFFNCMEDSSESIDLVFVLGFFFSQMSALSPCLYLSPATVLSSYQRHGNLVHPLRATVCSRRTGLSSPSPGDTVFSLFPQNNGNFPPPPPTTFFFLAGKPPLGSPPFPPRDNEEELRQFLSLNFFS